MGTSISQKIDAYAQANLKALKQEEAKTGRKMTKFDIAQYMLQHGKLQKNEYANWLNTREGFDAQSMTQAQKTALRQGNIWGFSGYGGGQESYLDSMTSFAQKNPVEKQNAISGHQMKLNETVAERKKKAAEITNHIRNQRLMNPKKTAEEQKFKAHVDSLQISEAEKNKTASQLTKEIEQQNVEMLSHDDRKKFIMDKFQDAAAKKDFSGMKNALSEFNSYMCKHIDDQVGVTATKDAIKKYSGLNALVDYVDNLVDDGDETNLSKLETAWNITKGLGDAVDGFLGAEGLEMVGALGAASKAASVANVGKYFAVATQSYFGVEGSQLIGAGLAHAQTAETEYEARLAGSEIGMGSMMLGGAVKSVKTGIKNAKIAEIKGAVEEIRADYSQSFEQIKADLKAMRLDDIGNMSIRLKGEQSLYDKIANYMKEHKGASLEDAIKDVRDAIGARTVVKSGDFKSNPEVKALLEAGREQEAILKAAEIQSKPAVDALKAEILKQEQNGNKFTIARISNYVAKNGIPYFSENQLAELKQFAINHGVKLKINLRIDENDPNFSKVDANYKPTTKSQPSGYTALQANFTTKEGKIIEWQFRGDRVNEFAEGEHVPYDLRTGKDIIGKHKELEPLYNPIKKLLLEENMSKDTYKEYNRYLGDYYNHLRKLELGFESVEPRLEDYGNGFKFDERLKAKNLITLHEMAEMVKAGKISKPAIDIIMADKVNVEMVKKLYPNREIQDNSFVQNIKKIIEEIPENIKQEAGFKTIDYTSKLTDKDFEIIANILNIQKGELTLDWFRESRDGIDNLQKLALFARVIDFTEQHKDFTNFDNNQWSIVLEGTIEKPVKYIFAVMKYKNNSRDYNIALDTGVYKSELIKVYSKLIEEYLNNFSTKEELKVYRGEGGYGILNTSGNANLGSIVENYLNNVNENVSDNDIKLFLSNNLIGKVLKQKRYLSTALTPEATQNYKGVIFWEELIVPPKTHGAFIESYCVERSKEAEFLMQRGASIVIKAARYDRENSLLILKGNIAYDN